ncbi:MAG: DUF5667 domain-containing protein [Patescibacteria group bacterium]
MHSRDLINSLQQLRAGQPNPAWVSRTREILLSQIKAQRAAVAESASPMTTFRAFRMSNPWAVRSGALAMAVVVLVFGTTITNALAQDTVAGDFLYTVKLTTERIQFGLTTDQTAQTQLAIDLAGKRVSELKKITATSQSNIQKAAQIKTTLAVYTQNMTAAGSKLDSLAGAADQVVKIATVVTQKAEEYSRELATSSPVVEGDTQANIQAAITMSNSVADAAVFVIVQKNTSGEATTDSATLQPLAEQQLEQAKERVKAAPSVKASQELQEAEKLLQDGETVSSLEKVLDAKQTVADTISISPTTRVTEEVVDNTAVEATAAVNEATIEPTTSAENTTGGFNPLTSIRSYFQK